MVRDPTRQDALSDWCCYEADTVTWDVIEDVACAESFAGDAEQSVGIAITAKQWPPTDSPKIVDSTCRRFVYRAVEVDLATANRTHAMSDDLAARHDKSDALCI